MSTCRIIIRTLILLFLIGPARINAQNEPPMEIVLDKWLILGPYPVAPPAFFNNDNKSNSNLISDLPEALLHFDEIEFSRIWPEADDKITLSDGSNKKWKEIATEGDALILDEIADRPGICYLATYVEVPRWSQAKLTVQSPQILRIYFNGRLVKTKDSISRNTKNNTNHNGLKVSTDLAFETGKHLILIKTVYDPASNSNWNFKATLTMDHRLGGRTPFITISPTSPLKLSHLVKRTVPADISISPKGTHALVTMRKTNNGNNRESWIELYDLKENRLLRTLGEAQSVSNIKWAPKGLKYAFTTFQENQGTLWISDLETGSTRPVMRNMKNLSNYIWSSNADFFIYSIVEEGSQDTPGVRRILTMPDRQAGWRNRSFLYRCNIKDGMRQRLTTGKLSTGISGICPDGKRLLFTRTLVDLKNRPFTLTELYTLDLKTLQAELIWAGQWLASAQWGPENRQILMLGGPSLFGDLGRNLVSGVLPNEYDTQAYLYDLDTKKADPLTREFDPSINQVFWNQAEKSIYFTAQDKSYVHLFRLALENRKIMPMECGTEVIERLAMALESPTAVYIGSDADSPQKTFQIDLKEMKYQPLPVPESQEFRHVELGNIEPWAFRNSRGLVIEGRIYYPPDFDKQKKYPLIVHYYGGTSPVNRSFGGRYPMNYYAANGYLVLVIQPSGATGFGQQFSALHVNDWGLVVADDIITGTRKFLSEFSYADSNRVGCIGASYGGFMTMHLLTQTNMFAAGVAHAGISSIASYWGEGYWGYLYSAYATANSFPWNRKDIYVEQSPLYSADKISTPLLLLHGSADTNVPPGESTQMFTALKLLGREVEYLQIPDQNHHIINPSQRIIWTKSIIAWFDRWLKHQSEWWDSLYPHQK